MSAIIGRTTLRDGISKRPVYTTYWALVGKETTTVQVTYHGPDPKAPPQETALVKCGSHRARGKLFQLVGRENAQAMCSMRRDTGTGGVYRIPAERAAEAKAITGVSGFRDGDDLMRCWPSTPVSEVIR